SLLLRFATVIYAPIDGSLPPNDRLHKTFYTLYVPAGNANTTTRAAQDRHAAIRRIARIS
ncbi:hypothetical protein, partial [Paraburkholderia nodosa]|uniref:hypothetical protein n=1 Tax=Paraburkholderia nodosa TaxID=392320 RepID=UPI001B804BAB